MRKIGIALCLLLFFCTDAKTQKISKIRITSIALITTVAVPVNCNRFDTSVDDNDKKVVVLNDKKNIRKLSSLLLNNKRIKDLTSIDVRGKIEIYYVKSNLKNIVCFDGLGQFYNKGMLFRNKGMFDFLIKNKFIEY